MSKIPIQALSLSDRVEKLKENFNVMESRIISDDEIKYFEDTELYFPVIPVENKYYLLARNTGDSENIVNTLEFMSSWFDIKGRFKDENNNCYIDIETEDELGKKVSRVSFSTFFDRNLLQLGKYGITINSLFFKSFSCYFLKYLATLRTESAQKIIGFEFVKDKLVFQAYDQSPVLLDYTYDVEFDEYRQKLNNLITNPNIAFALCCGIVSTSLCYISKVCNFEVKSFMISFIGKSTTGKSTMQALIASIWSNIQDKKIFLPYYGTLNSIIKSFDGHFGVPQILDEATVTTNLHASDMIYTLSMEREKRRCASNSQLLSSGSWKMNVITSSEEYLLDTHKIQNKGLSIRCLNFENLQYTDSREHAEKIHDFCVECYGILGRKISEYFVNISSDEIMETYNDCRNELRKIFSEESFDLTERLINEYALFTLSARILGKFKIKINYDGIIDILTNNHKAISISSNIAENCYHYLISYITRNIYNSGIRIDETNKRAIIVDTLFEEILMKAGVHDVKLAVKELCDNGYIIRQKSNARKSRLRINSVLVSCYQLDLSNVTVNLECDDGEEFDMEDDNYEC